MVPGKTTDEDDLSNLLSLGSNIACACNSFFFSHGTAVFHATGRVAYRKTIVCMHRLTTNSSSRKSNPTSIPLLFCVSINVPAEPSKHKNTSRNCTYLTKMMEWQWGNTCSACSYKCRFPNFQKKKAMVHGKTINEDDLSNLLSLGSIQHRMCLQELFFVSWYCCFPCNRPSCILQNQCVHAQTDDRQQQQKIISNINSAAVLCEHECPY